MKMSHQLIAFPRRRAWSGYDQPEAVPPGTFLFLALVFAFAMPSASKADSTYHYSQPTEPTLRDVVYSDKSPKETLDLYLPAEKNAAPLIIWIHGGHFQFGDKSSMPRRNFGPPPAPRGLDGPYQIQVPDVTALLAKGYAVASLNYRIDYRPGSDIYPAVVAAVQVPRPRCGSSAPIQASIILIPTNSPLGAIPLVVIWQPYWPSQEINPPFSTTQAWEMQRLQAPYRQR
jgi:hypothetical protein